MTTIRSLFRFRDNMRAIRNLCKQAPEKPKSGRWSKTEVKRFATIIKAIERMVRDE